MAKDFISAVGEVLGAARRARALTLKDVERRSRGRFSASAVGGYERGERGISLDRFASLASLYGIPADGLLAEIVSSPAPRHGLTLDVTKLGVIDPDIGRRVGELIHWIRSQREDSTADVIALRSGDAAAVASHLGMRVSELARELRPAIVPVRHAQPGADRALAAPHSPA